ncbi:MAG: hypothetical protein Q8T11_06855 [Elusimicrobiota bacterium]|nr:hypothetical protein [Elusimicrobiota bacterium]
MLKKSAVSVVAASILISGPGGLTLEAAARSVARPAPVVAVTPSLGVIASPSLSMVPAYIAAPSLAPAALTLAPTLAAVPTMAAHVAIPAASPAPAAAALAVPVVPGAARLPALEREVERIVSFRDAGEQAEALGRIFDGSAWLPAASAAPADGLSLAARLRAGRISPELENILRPGKFYDVTVDLVSRPTVAEEDQLIYYLSSLDGVSYRRDRRSEKIEVQGITGRDIRVIAGFPAVNRIAGAAADAAAKGAVLDGVAAAPGRHDRLFTVLMDERAERFRASHGRPEFLSGHGNSLLSTFAGRMGWMGISAAVAFALTGNVPALAASAFLTLAATAARGHALHRAGQEIGGLYEAWGLGLESLLRLTPSMTESEKARLALGMYDLLSFPRRVRVFGRYYPPGIDDQWHRWASKFRSHLASHLNVNRRLELTRLSFERSRHAIEQAGKRGMTDTNAYFSALMPLRLHPLLNERQNVYAIESLLEFHERWLWVTDFRYPMDGHGFDEVDQMLRDGKIPGESIRRFYPRFHALLDRPRFSESRPLLLKILNRMSESLPEKGTGGRNHEKL